jgi:hypothetical protein
MTLPESRRALLEKYPVNNGSVHGYHQCRSTLGLRYNQCRKPKVYQVDRAIIIMRIGMAQGRVIRAVRFNRADDAGKQ